MRQIFRATNEHIYFPSRMKRLNPSSLCFRASSNQNKADNKGRCFQYPIWKQNHLYFSFANFNTSKSLKKNNAVSDGDNTNTNFIEKFNYEGCNVLSVLHQTTLQFQSSKVSEPILSACHLLSFVLDLPWSNGFSLLRQSYENYNARNNDSQNDATFSNHDNLIEFFHPKQRTLTKLEADIYQSMCERRINHEPLQYILGKWDFYDDMIIQCRAPILCPRPETEELVEIMIQEIKNHIEIILKTSSQKDKVIRILDVGCGTGAIGIALIKHFRKYLSKRNVEEDDIKIEVVAIDILKEAVELSVDNANQILGNGDDEMTNSVDLGYHAFQISAIDYSNKHVQSSSDIVNPYKFDFDMVVSNPPYIPTLDMRTLSPDVLEHESTQALCGGNDGMDIIRDIVERLPEWTAKDGNIRKAVCWMEVDTSHPKLIEEWLTMKNHNSKVEFVESRQDLSGRDRFVKIRVGKPPN